MYSVLHTSEDMGIYFSVSACIQTLGNVAPSPLENWLAIGLHADVSAILKIDLRGRGCVWPRLCRGEVTR